MSYSIHGSSQLKETPLSSPTRLSQRNLTRSHKQACPPPPVDRLQPLPRPPVDHKKALPSPPVDRQQPLPLPPVEFCHKNEVADAFYETFDNKK